MLFRFGFWGLFSASIYFGTYALLLFMVDITPLLSSLAAFLVSVMASFFLNSRFVFIGRKGSFVRFFAISLNGLLLNLLIIFFFTEIFIINNLVAGVIVVIAVPIHNFALNLLLNFKKSNET
tara:strand:+ start:351 stop:716 length:366 start_codon:yes stop_codon:yes gene_type:complete